MGDFVGHWKLNFVHFLGSCARSTRTSPSNKIGFDTAIVAHKLYRERKRFKVDDLMQFVGIWRVEKVFRPYLEVLLWLNVIRINRLKNVPQDFGKVIKAIAVFLGPVAKTPAAEKLLEATWKAPGRRWYLNIIKSMKSMDIKICLLWVVSFSPSQNTFDKTYYLVGVCAPCLPSKFSESRCPRKIVKGAMSCSTLPLSNASI